MPALGPEVDIAIFDLSDADTSTVGLTKPDDPDKLMEVLKKGDDPPKIVKKRGNCNVHFRGEQVRSRPLPQSHLLRAMR